MTETGEFDPNIPNVARMYDYFLGGKDNFPADRAAAEKVLEIVPHIPVGAKENRAFLGRAVEFLVDIGIRQFLDIGAGLPTQRNVHQVAHERAPEAKIVYVDHDPQVLAHARALLVDSASVTVLHGDVRHPGEILAQARQHLDFSEPVALLLLAVIHFIPENPAPVIAELMDALPEGSYLVLSHVCSDIQPKAARPVERVYKGASAQFVARTSPDIIALFDGYDVIDPGVVNLPMWHPGEPAELAPFRDAPPYFLCGVARKPPA
ncbi:SAM-dependent methyltransferase [Nonomuraea sp. NBC_01738]|uniref:SAM-dependent methyltransferase n=1 Tax=Nonomuraea sp. NBC_01738 TaxID=2976003 RepID=UPI002E1490AE|nr:SAM-dependent methyltransferase [Nonomuraea sp. NBC_01738]